MDLTRETKNAYKILVGKPLRRPRRRWGNNINVDLGGIGMM
jgi:hypothetical protein